MREKGFTLIELIVSVGLFAVIMTISIGTLVGVFNENRKAETLKAAMDNLTLALEGMSRELRFGTTYACGQDPVPASSMTANDCPNSPSYKISFVNQNGRTIGYRFVNNSGVGIERWTQDTPIWLPLTAPEVGIQGLQSFKIYVIGTPAGDGLQPKVIININGIAGRSNKPSLQTTFIVQTEVSQRSIDY